MSQQDMDRLREVIASELGLARDGIGYEAAGVADEIVSKYVEPLLARVEASRRDWAAEAARAQEKVHQLLGLLDCVHDTEPCWFDHHGGCQAHGFLDLQRGEVCPQQEIGEELGAAERDADADPWAPCSCLTPEGAAFVAAQPKWSLPLCAVHPEVER